MNLGSGAFVHHKRFLFYPCHRNHHFRKRARYPMGLVGAHLRLACGEPVINQRIVRTQDGSPSKGEPCAPETKQPPSTDSESMFGAESGNSSQTRWVPDNKTFWLSKERLLGISDTGYIARRATGCARVATITDNRAAQVRNRKTHIHSTRRILQAEVVLKTLIGVTHGFQAHQVARPGHTINCAELAH